MMPRRKLGPFGLPFVEYGEVLQAMLVVLNDRGFTRAELLESIRREDFNEQIFWDQIGGPACDSLETLLDPAAPIHGDA